MKPRYPTLPKQQLVCLTRFVANLITTEEQRVSAQYNSALPFGWATAFARYSNFSGHNWGDKAGTI